MRKVVATVPAVRAVAVRAVAGVVVAVVVAAVGAGVGGCGKSEPSGPAKDGASVVAPPPLAPLPVATPGRPGMIRPIVTAGGATLAAAAKPFWFEVDMACYTAAITMNGEGRAIDPIEKVRPGIGAALTAAGFDFEKDLLSVSMTGCGSGLCMYFGVAVKDAAQMRALVSGVLGRPPEEPEPGHFVTRFQGPAGERAVHLRFLPIDWNGLALPDDPRTRELRRATHLIFLFADAASAPVVDPFALVAEPVAGQERVAGIESLAADRRGRCAIGELPPMAGIRPGFDLTGGAFIAVTPPRVAEDQLAALIGATRSFDLEVRLDLSRTPTTADVEGWIEQARQAFTAIASGTPAPPALVELIRVILEKALAYRVGDGHLFLSWHTSRVPKESLDAAEKQLQQMMGTR